MLTTLAVVAALTTAPAQTGELKLSNARATYGVLGAPRPNDNVLPGESYHIAFDIENLQPDAKGEVQYSMGMKVVNPKGQTEYEKAPGKEPNLLFNILGGNTIPAFAHASTEPGTDPGEYTITVTVIDGRTKKSQSVSKKFAVLKRDFGIIDLSLSYDGQGRIPAPPVGVAGQTMILNFWTAFFTIANKKVNVALTMTVIDEATGKPTNSLPVEGKIDEEVPADATRYPLSYILPLNRAGKYSVELTATDKNAGNKTIKLKFPLTVYPQK